MVSRHDEILKRSPGSLFIFGMEKLIKAVPKELEAKGYTDWVNANFKR